MPALEGWIKNYYKESAFNQCRRLEWPVTTGKPMTIQPKSDAGPHCCKKPTVVPLNFKAKADIEAEVMKGILEQVPVDEPDSWCSRMVIQERRNGRARQGSRKFFLSDTAVPER